MQLEQIRSHPPPDVATGVSAGMSAQVWRDVTFLHWRYDAGTIAPLLPRGLVPDEYGGSSWVGLVGLRMVRVRLTGMPLGRWDFLETNLRLYAVDEHGQRGCGVYHDGGVEPVVRRRRQPRGTAAVPLRRHENSGQR